MKHQQVIPDYQMMLNSSITCILLAIGGWVLIRLIQAIFMLPGYMARQQNELYEKLQQQADEMCSRGRTLHGDVDVDDDGAGVKSEINSSNVEQGNEVESADGAVSELVAALDDAAPLEEKKCN